VVFYARELARRFPAEYEEAKRLRLLHRVTTADDGWFDTRTNRLLVVEEDQGELEAIDVDDPEASPIPLVPQDLERYALDLEVFAAIVQRANQLSGTPTPLSDRLFFLGDSDKSGVSTACILAFINGSSIAHPILTSLPSILPKSYSQITVACPTHVPTPTERRQLEGLTIKVASLRPDNPTILTQFSAPPEDPASKIIFDHADDYSWIKWKGTRFRLSKRRAAVIEMLHRAYLAHSQILSWDQISRRLQNPSATMSDLFKDSPLWKTLVIEVGHGLYRLNI